ncbi:MAG: hypothetical protein VKL41_19325, partial [Snowella sp.]|nr:hypothetical protein [Snowella sp.]
RVNRTVSYPKVNGVCVHRKSSFYSNIKHIRLTPADITKLNYFRLLTAIKRKIVLVLETLMATIELSGFSIPEITLE